MAIRITDEEWDELTPENFATTLLLCAIDAVDEMRNDLNDGEYGTPPQPRTHLLKRHQLAMAVFNEGARSQVAELFEFGHTHHNAMRACAGIARQPPRHGYDGGVRGPIAADRLIPLRQAEDLRP